MFALVQPSTIAPLCDGQGLVAADGVHLHLAQPLGYALLHVGLVGAKHQQLVETVHDGLSAFLAHGGHELTFRLDAGNHTHAKFTQSGQLYVQLDITQGMNLIQKEPISVINDNFSFGRDLAEGHRQQKPEQRREHRLCVVRA